MSDLLAVTVIVAGFCALVFIVAVFWLGLRFWLMCGSFASGHRIIDARHQIEDEQLDELARRGFEEADKRGLLP